MRPIDKKKWVSDMSISPIFKVQVEQDIGRCESQKSAKGSEELYDELVNRYKRIIENFTVDSPFFRKKYTPNIGVDYRPELQLIASELRMYLLKKEREDAEMPYNPLKAKVDEFIQHGIDIGRMEFHPGGDGFPISYVSGPMYDIWMGEINIFNERHLKEHPLHDSISASYSQYRKNSSSYDEMMGHLRALSADAEFFMANTIQLPNGAGKSIMSNKIFIVHGHDNVAKLDMARTLEKAGFEAIILHEQPDAGRTIIEKFENYADVGFAVILYTECDLGRDKETPEGSEKFRARQNVVFEHGFFLGKLGRDRVCAFVKGDVETPGDLGGVLYIPMDDAGAWKMKLAQNMNAAGLTVDMNRFI